MLAKKCTHTVLRSPSIHAYLHSIAPNPNKIIESIPGSTGHTAGGDLWWDSSPSQGTYKKSCQLDRLHALRLQEETQIQHAISMHVKKLNPPTLEVRGNCATAECTMVQ